MICPKCKGSGNRAKWDQIPDYRYTLKCEKCNGDGELDWIEMIVGKKKLDPYIDLPTIKKNIRS